MKRTAVSFQSRGRLRGLLGVALCGACIGSCITAVRAAESPQAPRVLNGGQLARIACSTCHVVSADPEAPLPLRDVGPRFDDIANRAGSSEKALRQFITTTHWDGESIPMTMPKPDLTQPQVAAVAHYIMSLRKH